MAILCMGGSDVVAKGTASSTISLSPANVVLVPHVPEKVKVLSLGNSLIYNNSQYVMFNNIARAMGKNAKWTPHTLLGKSLLDHWNEGEDMTEEGTQSAKMLVRSDSWTHIILQDKSDLSRTDKATFISNVKRWVDYIREWCPNPNAVIIVPINWANIRDWDKFSVNNSASISGSKEMARELGITLCPVAVAYQMIYDDEGKESALSLFSDAVHPTYKATYLAAIMEYGLIFGEDPRDIAYSPYAVSEAEAKSMRRYASRSLTEFPNYVNHPEGKVRYEVTLNNATEAKMKYTVNMCASSGGRIDANHVFTSNGSVGSFSVEATVGDLTADATVTVTEAKTRISTDVMESQGTIEISIDSDAATFPGLIEAFGVNGQKVAGGTGRLSLTSLCPGIYILRATNERVTSTVKISR